MSICLGCTPCILCTRHNIPSCLPYPDCDKPSDLYRPEECFISVDQTDRLLCSARGGSHCHYQGACMDI